MGAARVAADDGAAGAAKIRPRVAAFLSQAASPPPPPPQSEEAKQDQQQLRRLVAAWSAAYGDTPEQRAFEAYTAQLMLELYPDPPKAATRRAVKTDEGPVAVLESALAKPRPTQAYAGGSRTLPLHAARNEVESFLVVINGGGAGLTGVTVHFPPPLAGGAVTLHAARYVNATKPTGCSGAVGEPHRLFRLTPRKSLEGATRNI